MDNFMYVVYFFILVFFSVSVSRPSPSLLFFSVQFCVARDMYCLSHKPRASNEETLLKLGDWHIKITDWFLTISTLFDIIWCITVVNALKDCDEASVHLKHFSKVLSTFSNQDGINAESQTNQFHIQQVSCVAQRLGSLFWSVKTDPFGTYFSKLHPPPLFPAFVTTSTERRVPRFCPSTEELTLGFSGENYYY